MRVCEEVTLRASLSFQPPQKRGGGERKNKLCHTQVSRHAPIKYAKGPLHYTYFGIPAGKAKHGKQASCLGTQQPAARGDSDSAGGWKELFVVVRKTAD